MHSAGNSALAHSCDAPAAPCTVCSASNVTVTISGVTACTDCIPVFGGGSLKLSTSSPLPNGVYVLPATNLSGTTCFFGSSVNLGDVGACTSVILSLSFTYNSSSSEWIVTASLPYIYKSCTGSSCASCGSDRCQTFTGSCSLQAVIAFGTQVNPCNGASGSNFYSCGSGSCYPRGGGSASWVVGP